LIGTPERFRLGRYGTVNLPPTSPNRIPLA